jgi:hypothetical protein
LCWSKDIKKWLWSHNCLVLIECYQYLVMIKWSSSINNMLPTVSYDHSIVVSWWSVVKCWLWSPNLHLFIEINRYLIIINWSSLTNHMLSTVGYDQLIVVYWSYSGRKDQAAGRDPRTYVLILGWIDVNSLKFVSSLLLQLWTKEATELSIAITKVRHSF